MSDLLLGIDVGTSVCKAAVVDATGAERAHGQQPTPWQRLPTARRSTPTRCSRRLWPPRAPHSPTRPRAGSVRIGVTSMAEAGVLLDARGEATRAGDRLARRPRRRGGRAGSPSDLGERAIRRSTPGCPPARCARSPSSRWLVEHRPATRAGRALAERGRVGRAPTRRTRRGRAVAGLAHRAARPADSNPVRRGAGMGRPARRPAARARARRHARRDVDEAVLPDAAERSSQSPATTTSSPASASGLCQPGDVLDSCGTAEALVRVVAPPLDGDAGASQRRGRGHRRLARRRGPAGAARQRLVGPRAARGARRARRRRARPRASSTRERSPRQPATRRRSTSSCTRSIVGRCTCPPACQPERIWRGAIDAVAAEAQAVLAHIESGRRTAAQGRRHRRLGARRGRAGLQGTPGRGRDASGRRSRCSRRRATGRRGRRPVRERRLAAPDPDPGRGRKELRAMP